MTNKKTLPVFLLASSVRLSTPVAVALFALFLALFYASPWQMGAWAALAAWGVVAVLRPDVAICVVAATIPFVFQPRLLGPWSFAPAEVTLLLTFGAVILRRVLTLFAPPLEDAASLFPHPTPLPEGEGAAAPLSPTGSGAGVTGQATFIAHVQSAIRNPQSPFTVPALAWVAVGTFSLLTVAEPGYVKNSLHEYRWAIIEPVLFFFLATDLLRGPRGALRLADGLVVGAVGAAGGALVLWVLGQGLPVEGVLRVMWPYNQPNNLGLLLGRIGPFAACLALFLTAPADLLRRRLYAAACVPLFLALLLTFSRGAYLGVVAAGLVMAWLVGRRRIAGVIGGLIVAGLGVLLADHVVPFLPARLHSLGSTELRFGIWGSALAMLRDHPIFGVGLDQFLPEFQKYIQPGNDYERFTSHPHNIILDFWLRLGIIGLLILGWTLAQLVIVGLALLKAGDPLRRAMALAVLAATTDMVVHGLLDNAYFVMDLAFIFWAGCALLQLARSSNGEPDPAMADIKSSSF